MLVPAVFPSSYGSDGSLSYFLFDGFLVWGVWKQILICVCFRSVDTYFSTIDEVCSVGMQVCGKNIFSLTISAMLPLSPFFNILNRLLSALPTSKASWDGKVSTGCTLKNTTGYCLKM